MKVYKQPVKAHPWADQVRVSRTQEGRWFIVRGSNWTELPAYSFENWDHALWTGIAWANEEYHQRVAEHEAAAYQEKISAAENRSAAETI